MYISLPTSCVPSTQSGSRSSKSTKAGKATATDNGVAEDEEEGEVEEGEEEGEGEGGATQPELVGASDVQSALLKKGLLPKGAGRGRGGKVKKQ